jgi:FixJ family two-component response regulator
MGCTRQAVFIVDDDLSVRKALKRLLRAAGWTVATFASAEEFLDFPAAPAPGCLVVDVHLPGLNGLELQARLRAEGRSIPTVFITAYEDEQVREKALQSGAKAFLQKPFDDAVLLDAVERATG